MLSPFWTFELAVRPIGRVILFRNFRLNNLYKQLVVDCDVDEREFLLDQRTAKTMNTIDKHPEYEERIAQFFNGLPIEDREVNSNRFTYVAVKRDNTWNLLRGRLDFNPLPRRHEPPLVDLEFVRAATIDLAKAGLTPMKLLTDARNGQVTFNGQTYDFPKDGCSHHFVDYTRDVYANEGNRPVISRLQVSGKQNNELWDYAAVQLDLKGVPAFYGTLEELLAQYGLRPEFGSAALWLYQWPKAQVTNFCRKIDCCEVEVSVRLGYNTELITLAVSNKRISSSAVALTFSNEQLKRRIASDQVSLVAHLPVTNHSEPEIIVMYDRKVQHLVRP